MTENNNTKQAVNTVTLTPASPADTTAKRMREFWRSDDPEIDVTRRNYMRLYELAPVVYLLKLDDPRQPIKDALSDFLIRYCGRYYGLGRARQAAIQDVRLRRQAASPASRGPVTPAERETFQQMADSDYDIVKAEGMCYLFRKPTTVEPATT